MVPNYKKSNNQLIESGENRGDQDPWMVYYLTGNLQCGVPCPLSHGHLSGV